MEDFKPASTNQPGKLIMDNLIAAGKAKPFIIVMDNGSGLRPAGPPPKGPGGPPRFDFSSFAKIVTEELIPYIGSHIAKPPNFSASPGGKRTAFGPWHTRADIYALGVMQIWMEQWASYYQPGLERFSPHSGGRRDISAFRNLEAYPVAGRLTFERL